MGISNLNNAASYAQPYITNAAGITQNTLNTPLNAAQYMSPYTQQVVDATQAQFNNQNQQQNQQLLGNAISQGALGGNRVGVAQANLANQQQLAQAPVIAGLYNQGYQSALQTAQQQQQAQLQGANLLGNLGVAGQNAALTGAGQQINAGTLQQQTQQAADQAAYEQFLQQQAYPFQTTQWLAGLGTGVGSQLGGTTTSSGQTTQPGQSWGSSILGGITSGFGMLGSSGAFGSGGWLSSLGLLSDERAKENIRRVGHLNDGQAIYSYNYKGDPTPRIGLLAQEVEKKHPEAVHEVNGVKNVDYGLATKDAKRASGGGVGPSPYYGVLGYIPTQGVSYGHTSFPQAASPPRPVSDDTSNADMKNMNSLTGSLSKAFDGFGATGGLGGNYDYNMAHPALTGITGMVAGGVRRGGVVKGYADGGVPAFAPDDPNPINFDSRWAGQMEKEPQYSPFVPQGVSFGDYYLQGATPAATPTPDVNTLPQTPTDTVTPSSAVAAQPLPVTPTAGVALPPERPITGREAVPEERGVVPTTPTAGYADTIDTYGRATKQMESGGNYTAVGPTVTYKDGTTDHAYGAYGVMGRNIPEWTQEVLGHPLTPQQFLNSPQAQDAVYRAKFGQLVNKYGPVGASKAWFAGEGGMNNPNAKDVLGTTVASYGDKFARLAGLAPGEGGGDGDANIPTNAQLTQAQGVAPPTGRQGFNWGADNKLWPALIAAGFGMMASRSPNMGVAIGEGGLTGMRQYGAELQREMQQRQLDMRAQQLQNQLDLQQRRIALAELPYKGVLTGAQQANLALNKAKLLESQRQHELQLRTPVKIGQAHDGTELYAMPRANPNGGVDLYPIDPQTRQISPVPMGNPLSPGGSNFQQGPSAAPSQQPQFTQTAYNPDAGIIPINNQLLQKPGGIDYSNTETIPPVIEKGMDVPEPSAVGGKDPRSIKTDAESYLQTGKLPPVRSGRSPVAVQQANYRNAVQNYANALAASRGVTPEQLATMWRQAPGMLRFVLGADGRATVSLGTAVRHLDTVAEYAKAWAANDVQTVNRLRAVVAREFGKDAATNLEAVGKIVGPEIVKAIGVAGAGTEGERSAVEKQFSTAASPAQIFGAIKATQKLLAGQLEGKRRQAANAGVPEAQFRSLIGERPYEILSSLEATNSHAAGAPGASAAGAAPKPMSPQDQQALSWANANPSDPRAAAIKKRLGVP